MSQIRWKFNGMPHSYTTEQLEGAGWTYPQICQYGKPVYEVSAPAWVGVGLPPVGLEVEFFEDGQWVPVRVMYMSEHTVLLKHLHDETGDPEGAYTPHDAQFRPVRTAEQLAAKVRSNACDEIYEVLCSAAREGNRSDMAEALYDAGYRKVQP